MRWKKESFNLRLEESLYRRKRENYSLFFIKLLRDKGERSYYIN